MKKPESTRSRHSRRRPRKSCGVFDTGLAGGDFDVTSFGYDASTGSLENFISADAPLLDVYAENKLDHIRHMVNTSHIPDQLSDIDVDQLANHNLDEFINLDQYLDLLVEKRSHHFFDDITDADPDDAILTQDSMIQTSTESYPPQAAIVSAPYLHKPAVDHLTFEPSATGIFNIPDHEGMVSDPQQDYDWLDQFENDSASSEDTQKHTTHEDSQRTSDFKSTLSSSHSRTSSESLDSEIAAEITSTTRKKSRDSLKKPQKRRKLKLSDLDEEAARLVEANRKLRQRIVEMEEMTKTMKAQLISCIVGN